MHVVIISLWRFSTTRFSASGKISNFHFGFAVNGDPQRFRIIIRGSICLTKIIENSICFWDFLERFDF